MMKPSRGRLADLEGVAREEEFKGATPRSTSESEEGAWHARRLRRRDSDMVQIWESNKIT